MRIVGPCGRWRWEYMLDYARRDDRGSIPKRWRLLIEDVAPGRLISSEQIPDGHPARSVVRHMLERTNEPVDIVPWAPFEPCATLLEAMGPHVVARMQAKEHDCKVWSSVDGWVWLHMLGDTALG